MYISGVVVMCAYSTEMEVTGSSPLQSGSFLFNFRQETNSKGGFIGAF